MIKIGKVIGDVIEAGGVKNVTNNYYDREPDGEAADMPLSKDDVPAELLTPEAEELWGRLRLAGFIREDGYLLAPDVSANQAAYIADRMAERLGLKRGKWKMFQHIWGIRNMAQLAGSWQQTGKLPPKHKEIDAMI